MHYAFRFVVAVLAVWRLTHMLAREDGPWDVFLRLRRRFASGMVGKAIGCLYCFSMWTALPLAFFLNGNAAETVVGWLALSGGAILLDRLAEEPLKLDTTEERRWDAAANR